MQRKMEEMLKPKPEPVIEPGIIELNDSNFDQIISAENATLVDFWAEWCGPCRSVSPVVEDLSGEYDGKVDFVKINVDENGGLAQKYNVLSIPTLAIFKNGEIVSRKVGSSPKESFKIMIDGTLK